MLDNGECGHLSKPCDLIHQWGKEYWFQRRDDLLFRGSVHGGVFSKQRLVLSELFSSKRLLLGVTHALWVVAWVVRRHKLESFMLPILLGRHRRREWLMLASSEV